MNQKNNNKEHASFWPVDGCCGGINLFSAVLLPLLPFLCLWPLWLIPADLNLFTASIAVIGLVVGDFDLPNEFATGGIQNDINVFCLFRDRNVQPTSFNHNFIYLANSACINSNILIKRDMYGYKLLSTL